MGLHDATGLLTQERPHVPVKLGTKEAAHKGIVNSKTVLGYTAHLNAQSNNRNIVKVIGFYNILIIILYIF